MAEDSSAAPKPFRMENVTHPDGMVYTYSNNFSIGQTIFDLRLIFGELAEISEERVLIAQRVQVTMTWLEAKALSESLAVYIRNYENAYGPIRTEFVPMTMPKMPEIPKLVPPATAVAEIAPPVKPRQSS